VLVVTGWLPRAAVLPADVADLVADGGELPPGTSIEALTPREEGRYRGSASSPGTLLVAEPADAGWIASSGGQPLSRLDGPLPRFPDVRPGVPVEVEHTGDVARSLAVTGQLLALLLAISLALRPPRFARRGPTPDEPDDAVGPRPRTPEVVG
jgi:hypothetical protein